MDDGAPDDGLATAVEGRIMELDELDELEELEPEIGPVYEDDRIVEVVPPMPRLIVFVLACGCVGERLVEYDELG